MRFSLPAVALALILGGCATSGVHMHRMPPETPAADNAAAIQKAAAFAAAQDAAQAAAQNQPQNGEAPLPLTAADAPPPRTYDPWERLNRFSYRFNARFDEAIFLPVAQGYRWIPAPIRTGVHNIFDNLSEVDSVINYTLQGRFRYGIKSLGRFVINSTIGIAGLLDVASHARLPYAPTGFGTTLAKWGMHPGPFLVIPFFGPSTLREAVGLLFDYGTNYGIDLGDLYRGNEAWGVGFVNAVDQRSNISFRHYSTGSPFEYETIRFLYVRKLLLEDAGLHRTEKPKKRDEAVPAGQ
jgi:phospholipid-binding lipoprotein MlaA